MHNLTLSLDVPSFVRGYAELSTELSTGFVDNFFKITPNDLLLDNYSNRKNKQNWYVFCAFFD
ncbi:MAG: hypothetical protein IPP76_09105 [Moraxellaceae bacterium]|nr:hypothetical protein [Moraxellaceae bacterium]